MNYTFHRVAAFCSLRLSYYSTIALLALSFLCLALTEYRTASPLYILLTFAVMPGLLKAMFFSGPKKEKEARRNQKVVDIKEVRLSAKIDVHDFEVRVKSAQKFLTGGDKVKASIRFRGREMAHTDLGLAIMDRFADALTEYGSVEKPAKLEGRQMLMFIAPLKK